MAVTTFDRTRLQQGREITTPWIELVFAPYPIGSGGGGTRWWSDRDYGDVNTALYGGYKSGQVQSFGRVSRSLSGWRDGQIRASSFAFSINDNPSIVNPSGAQIGGPGLLAQMLNDPNGQFWYNRVATMSVSTENDKLSSVDPLVLVRGYVTSYGTSDRFVFQFSCDDFLTSEFSAFNPQKKLPSRLVNATQFSDCPATSLGFPEPIIYGEVTDAPTTNQGAIPVLHVGSEVISSVTWQRFLVAGHAMSAITGWFAGGVPVSTGTAGVDFLVPGFSGWPFGPKYRDIGGRRYTLIYAKGLYADNHINGTAPITVNGYGVEDVGDGTGSQIDDIALQYRHFLTNYVFQDYLTGAWLGIPTWSPLTPTVYKLNSASFDTVRTQHHARLAFPYYRGAGVMGPEGQTAVRDAIAQWNICCDVQCGFNKAGEFIVFTDDTISTTADLTDVDDILDRPILLQPDTRELFNEIPYVYSPSYTTYQTALSSLRNCQASKDAYATRRLDSELVLRWVRDNATAQNIADHWAARLKDPPRYVRIPMPWHGANREVGERIRVTYNDYGWSLRTFRIEGIDIDVDLGLVELLCRDMTATVVSATTTTGSYDSRTGLSGTFSTDVNPVTIAAAIGALPCGGSMSQGKNPTPGTYVDVEEYQDVEIDWSIFASFNAYFRIDAATQDAANYCRPNIKDLSATGSDTVNWTGATTTIVKPSRGRQTITVTKPPSGGVHLYRLQVTRGATGNAFVYATGVCKIAP